MKPDFTLSADSKTLASVLKEAAVGETVSYERLSKAIGRDVREECRGALMTARRIVQRENRMVFDAVRGEGLMRLTDDSIVDLSDKGRDAIRRHSTRVAKKLTCADYDALSAEKKTKHNAALAIFGVLAAMTSDKSQRRLEAHVVSSNTADIPAAKATLVALGASL